MNDNSSRSHSVMTITLSSETQDPRRSSGNTYGTALTLCGYGRLLNTRIIIRTTFLAFIQRDISDEKVGYVWWTWLVVKRQSEQHSKGETLIEANNINTSLLVLGTKALTSQI